MNKGKKETGLAGQQRPATNMTQECYLFRRRLSTGTPENQPPLWVQAPLNESLSAMEHQMLSNLIWDQGRDSTSCTLKNRSPFLAALIISHRKKVYGASSSIKRVPQPSRSIATSETRRAAFDGPLTKQVALVLRAIAVSVLLEASEYGQLRYKNLLLSCAR